MLFKQEAVFRHYQLAPFIGGISYLQHQLTVYVAKAVNVFCTVVFILVCKYPRCGVIGQNGFGLGVQHQSIMRPQGAVVTLPIAAVAVGIVIIVISVIAIRKNKSK
ncbi:MAG: hypothetical protein IKC21_00680, partial [Ruminococcus sp.]|nr:hypothetical protein [Ruminococcus sp.]